MNKKEVRKAVVTAIGAMRAAVMTEAEHGRSAGYRDLAIDSMFKYLVALNKPQDKQSQFEQVGFYDDKPPAPNSFNDLDFKRREAIAKLMTSTTR